MYGSVRGPAARLRRPGPGFTLIELLVVIAILGVLLALLLPAVQKVRGAALRTQCANNLRQVGLALHHYHDAAGAFPPAVSYRDGADPQPFMSWLTRLLPYVEQQPLWEQSRRAFAQERDFHKNPPHTAFAMVVPLYACPADSRSSTVGSCRDTPVAFTAYLGVQGTSQFRRDGILYLDSRTRLADVTDGASNTLCVGERPPSGDGLFGWWYAGMGQSRDGTGDLVLGARERNTGPYADGCPPGPYEFAPGRSDEQCDLFHFWSLHVGGANFLLADGGVRFLPYSAKSVLPALATRAGGETASLPD